jgi:hypothetical protein
MMKILFFEKFGMLQLAPTLSLSGKPTPPVGFILSNRYPSSGN